MLTVRRSCLPPSLSSCDCMKVKTISVIWGNFCMAPHALNTAFTGTVCVCVCVGASVWVCVSSEGLFRGRGKSMSLQSVLSASVIWPTQNYWNSLTPALTHWSHTHTHTHLQSINSQMSLLSVRLSFSGSILMTQKQRRVKNSKRSKRKDRDQYEMTYETLKPYTDRNTYSFHHIDRRDRRYSWESIITRNTRWFHVVHHKHTK